MRENLNDLYNFFLIVREGSFTRAAAQLGVSQSALSHAMTSLEKRLGVRLLTRTTRSLSPTAAGERLLRSVEPRFKDIEQELISLSDLRDKPAGTIRISTASHAADYILWPKLKNFLHHYPDIKIEVIVDYALIDIVAQRYDAGIRPGDMLEKDMIAARISPDIRMAIVGSQEYLSKHPIPKKPQDLTMHQCINLRLPTYGGNYLWELQKGKKRLNVAVHGQLTFSSTSPIIKAVLANYGLAYLPTDSIYEYLDSGELTEVLPDWSFTFPGYHIYYPNRNSSPAFNLLLEEIKHKGPTNPVR